MAAQAASWPFARGSTKRFRRADFLSPDEVRELADGVLADFERLDLLVNNAGTGSDADGTLVSVEGFEPVFQVNYRAYFLLTEKLLPLLDVGSGHSLRYGARP